jgi:hypothetical protein
MRSLMPEKCDCTKPLTNRNHEHFVLQLLLPGTTQEGAYKAVYGDRKSARQNAHRLLTNADIQARLRHLRHKATTKAELSIDKALQRLGEYAFSSLGKFLRVDAAGRLYFYFSDATREELNILGEVQSECESWEDEDGRTVQVTKLRVKLADRVRALSTLLKYLTMDQRSDLPQSRSPLNAGVADAEYEETPADAALLQEWVDWLDMMMKIWEVDEEKRTNILAPLRNQALPTEEGEA